MTRHFRDWNYSQDFLLPPSIKDFVPERHLSHFIRNLVVEQLNLKEFADSYSDEGAPPFHPGMMVAVILYAYARGVYSSREIARACEERLDFLAVTGMEKPDFRTIAKFRKRHIDQLKGIFKQVLQACAAAGLVDLKHVAVDSTVMKANASKDRNLKCKDIKKYEEKLKGQVDDWFREAELRDELEDDEFGEDKRGDELPEWVKNKQERIERLRAAREKIEQQQREKTEGRKDQEAKGKKPKNHKGKEQQESTENEKYNFTDPDSRLVHSRAGFKQGYYGLVAVDAKNQIVVACEATTQRDVDRLIPALNQVKENMGTYPREASGDAGFISEKNLEELEARRIQGYIAVSRYYEAADGHAKRKCKPGTRVHAMQQKLKRAGRRSRYRLRKITVEPAFAFVKYLRNFSQFSLRGSKAVEAEWALVNTAGNLLKLAAAS
jgi:transposase